MNIKYCPKCGEVQAENAKFCRKCGTLLEESKKTRGRWIPIATVICVLVAVIGIAAVSILHGGKGSGDGIRCSRVVNDDGSWLEYTYNRDGNMSKAIMYVQSG